MKDENHTGASLSSSPKQSKQEKKKKPSQLADAWKFGSFCLRATLAAVTGKVVGNSSVDDAMGEAFATIYPPEEACDKGKHYSILVNGMAGAWKAARGDEEWE